MKDIMLHRKPVYVVSMMRWTYDDDNDEVNYIVDKAYLFRDYHEANAQYKEWVSLSVGEDSAEVINKNYVGHGALLYHTYREDCFSVEMQAVQDINLGVRDLSYGQVT